MYEDQFEIGRAGGRRLRHSLMLRIDGPDARRILQCMDEIVASRLAGEIAAAYPLGGYGLSNAVGRLLAQLTAELGSAYVVRLDDDARWIAADDSAALRRAALDEPLDTRE